MFQKMKLFYAFGFAAVVILCLTGASRVAGAADAEEFDAADPASVVYEFALALQQNDTATINALSAPTRSRGFNNTIAKAQGNLADVPEENIAVHAHAESDKSNIFYILDSRIFPEKARLSASLFYPDGIEVEIALENEKTVIKSLTPDFKVRSDDLGDRIY